PTSMATIFNRERRVPCDRFRAIVRQFASCRQRAIESGGAAMTRREMLAIGVGLTGLAVSRSWRRSMVVAAATRTGAPGAGLSLRDAAFANGITFGSAVPKEQLLANPSFATIVGQQCGILTPEVELKWKALRPSPDRYDFAAGGRVPDFCL